MQGDEAAVYADKAYDGRAFRDALTAVGIADGIMHKARCNRPLKDWQRWFNKAVAPIRTRVERSFAIMKASMATGGSATSVSPATAVIST